MSIARDLLKKVGGSDNRFRQLGEITEDASTKPSVYTNTYFIHRFKESLRHWPDIWRIIEVKGNQMLSSLHKAIFKTFDRIEELIWKVRQQLALMHIMSTLYLKRLESSIKALRISLERQAGFQEKFL